MESLSRGLKVLTVGGTDVNWSEAEIFLKNITANITFNFTDVVDKRIRLVLDNATGSDITVGFITPGLTISNLSNVMLRAPANRVLIYEFVADISNNNIYCLAPVRVEAVWQP